MKNKKNNDDVKLTHSGSAPAVTGTEKFQTLPDDMLPTEKMGRLGVTIVAGADKETASGISTRIVILVGDMWCPMTPDQIDDMIVTMKRLSELGRRVDKGELPPEAINGDIIRGAGN